LDGLSGTISAALIDVLGDPEADVESEKLGMTELIAVGEVIASLNEGLDHYNLSGEDLWLRREPIADGGLTETRLRVIGSVNATTQGSFGEFQLRSDRFVGTVYSRGVGRISDALADDAQGEMVAEGNVLVETLGGRSLRAEGGRLTLHHGGSGTLEPAVKGNVSAVGVLPGTERWFELVSQRLDFNSLELAARRPVIQLAALPGNLEPTPLDNLHASAGELVAKPGSLSFKGTVSFVGQMPSGSTWSLRCAEALFVGEPLEEKHRHG